jgi:hypothetical protein
MTKTNINTNLLTIVAALNFLNILPKLITPIVIVLVQELYRI